MAIHVALSHITHYQYDRFVNMGPHIVRLRPAPHSRTKVLSYSQRIEPENHFINWQQDPFANYQARLVFPERTRSFKVTVDMVVEMAVYNPFDFFLEPDAENYPFTYTPAQLQELDPYLHTEPATPLLQACLNKIDRTRRSEKIANPVILTVRVHCRTGSSEKSHRPPRADGGVHCRIGSSEIGR